MKDNHSKGGNIMTKRYLRVCFFVAVGLLLISCATRGTQKMKPSQPAFTAYEFPMADYEQKVDSFLVILDASGSMAEEYKEQSKFEIAREVARRMNKTIPDVELTGGLRSLGQGYSDGTVLVYRPQPLKRAEFGEALDSVQGAGKTPLGAAINQGSADLDRVPGKIAVIVLSDGKETDGSAFEAARAMKSRYGDRLCVYSVVVGDDPEGKVLMEQIAGGTDCGYLVSAEEIYSSQGMAKFVENVFLQYAAKPVAVGARLDSDGDGVMDDLDQCPDTPQGAAVDEQGCPLDSDGDGVADYLDQCPDTPKGAIVTSMGCSAREWVVLFDFDKFEIKPEAYPVLDKIVSLVKQNPQMKMEIQGHTDNVGSAEYNQKLSENRAKAIVDYLVRNGIDPKKLDYRGYGLTQPVASNDTEDGRAENRRVELERR
jgi:OOP family OmpA-OmpF porin